VKNLNLLEMQLNKSKLQLIPSNMMWQCCYNCWKLKNALVILYHVWNFQGLRPLVAPEKLLSYYSPKIWCFGPSNFLELQTFST